MAERGCEICDQGGNQWYRSEDACSCGNPIAASVTGGPFVQLAGLLYLDSAQLPIGPMTLAESAAHMLAAQRDWAAADPPAGPQYVWGWSSHANAGSCGYNTCPDFTAEVATPYICGLGLDLTPQGIGTSCAENLFEFDQMGAGAPLDTGTVLHDFGLRDAWNQATGTSREDAFLYLDTGWMALGAVNHCYADLVRTRFGSHPVAAAGYAVLDAFRGEAVPCRWLFIDGFESGDTSRWSGSVP